MCNSHIVHAEKSHREEPHFGDTSGHQSGTKMHVYMEKETPRPYWACGQNTPCTSAANGRGATEPRRRRRAVAERGWFDSSELNNSTEKY